MVKAASVGLASFEAAELEPVAEAYIYRDLDGGVNLADEGDDPPAPGTFGSPPTYGDPTVSAGFQGGCAPGMLLLKSTHLNLACGP